MEYDEDKNRMFRQALFRAVRDLGARRERGETEAIGRGASDDGTVTAECLPPDPDVSVEAILDMHEPGTRH